MKFIKQDQWTPREVQSPQKTTSASVEILPVVNLERQAAESAVTKAISAAETRSTLALNDLKDAGFEFVPNSKQLTGAVRLFGDTKLTVGVLDLAHRTLERGAQIALGYDPVAVALSGSDKANPLETPQTPRQAAGLDPTPMGLEKNIEDIALDQEGITKAELIFLIFLGVCALALRLLAALVLAIGKGLRKAMSIKIAGKRFGVGGFFYKAFKKLARVFEKAAERLEKRSDNEPQPSPVIEYDDDKPVIDTELYEQYRKPTNEDDDQQEINPGPPATDEEANRTVGDLWPAAWDRPTKTEWLNAALTIVRASEARVRQLGTDAQYTARLYSVARRGAMLASNLSAVLPVQTNNPLETGFVPTPDVLTPAIKPTC